MKKLITLFTLAITAGITSSLVAPGYFLAMALVLGLLSFVLFKDGVALSTIPVSDARNLFTKTLFDVYREKIKPLGFLKSFFPSVETTSKNVSIEVRRGKEKIAADVYRHSNGNRLKMSKSSEKIWTPPYYDQYIVCNEHELYDVAIGARSPEMYARLADEMADELMEARYTIDRAYELQCAQVIDTGIVTLNSGDNINFKRQAASLVDKGAGNYWNVGTVSPYDDLEAGCQFLRKEGKATGGVFNAIMGSEALSEFLSNDIVKERADIRRIALDDLQMPQTAAEGGVFHGQVSCGSYKVNIWTYEEYYEDADNVLTSYIDSKKVILLPLKPRFKTAFAAVPQLITDGNTIPQRGAFLIQEFIDEKRTAHEVHIKSAGIAVPVAVDEIYTIQVVA